MIMKLTQEQYEKISKHLPRQRGVLDKVFTALQAEGIININSDVVCLDSTTINLQ